MKIEDIEKAAQDYDDDLIYSSISEQYNVIKAFKAGANIESIRFGIMQMKFRKRKDIYL